MYLYFPDTPLTMHTNGKHSLAFRFPQDGKMDVYRTQVFCASISKAMFYAIKGM